MNNLQKPRGTQDIFFNDIIKFDSIINHAQTIAKKHNFHHLKTPTFEYSSLFERNIGEETDAISKELYRFTDRGERNLALRPELTAGVVRAFLENPELNSHPTPLRLFSYGQVFRYDRPKKGRYREFHQINFEFFNEENDIPAIGVAIEILQKLSIIHKVKLLINQLGDAKIPYTKAIKEYFTSNIEKLSEVSKKRLENNPLRILDSKEPEDILLLPNCPKIMDFHSEDDQNNLNKITEFLKRIPELQFEIDQNLVRGLDYYTGIIFEFIAPISEDGGNLAILGGGRYNNLISQMGGKVTKAIGFGGGIERISLLLTKPKPIKRIFIINAIEDFNSFEFINKLSIEFEEASFQEIPTEKNKIGKTLQKLSTIENSFGIIIGEKETQNGKTILKNLQENKEIAEIII